MRAFIEFSRSQIDYALEQPIERLLKPGIKAVVLIGLLTIAAQAAADRAMDRQALTRLTAKAGTAKEPVKTGSIKR
jgi:hypothetical protein